MGQGEMLVSAPEVVHVDFPREFFAIKKILDELRIYSTNEKLVS